MSSPVAALARPLTPPSRPTIPRSQPPRPHSNPATVPSTPSTSSSAARHSSSVLPRRPSIPQHASSVASSSTSSSRPVVTPSTSFQVPQHHPLARAGKGLTGESSASINTLANGGGGGGGGGGVMGTPQTGASKMAAAAKRGAQGGLDGARGGAAGLGADERELWERRHDDEEEEHPLSEKCLRARGYQTIHTHSRLFHLPTRFHFTRSLGQGAYGLVVEVQDQHTDAKLAVKCITRVFDKVILARRALREITLLRHFEGHENLTSLIDLDNVWEGYNEIYLYMEPMDADLHQIIRSGQSLSNSHIQYFMYQLCRGMKYIHSANVIHRDLKPGNLLVSQDCELKICDFGLARGFRPVVGEANASDELKLTEYVATRWYRAPEVMLSNRRYTTAIDVWSMGCILAELLGGGPVFKGKDYVDQLNLILEVLGTPSEETLATVGSEKACGYIRTLPFSRRKPWEEVLPDSDPDALELLSHLLVFDPKQRLAVPEALAHPYLAMYHDEADEPSCPEIFTKWEQVESLDTIEELRAAITKEIDEFRAEVRTVPPSEWGEAEEGVDDAVDSVVLGEQQAMVLGSPLPMAERDLDRLSPRSSTRGVSPGSVPFPVGSRGIRETSPHTPFSALSDDSFSAPAPSHSGRSSRRTSGHSIYGGRRPNSFLFSNPLGAGMTPMTSTVPLPGGGEAGSRETWHAGMGMGRRSRAGSSTGSAMGDGMRPLLRQLSTVGLDIGGKEGTGERSAEAADAEGQGQDGKAGRGGQGDGGVRTKKGGRLDDLIPPMRVTPSDAPPSERPKGFA